MTTRSEIVSVQPGALLGGTVQAGALTKAFTDCDADNGNKTTLTGTELFLVWNTDSGAQTITFSSVADSMGRVGDIANYSVAANGHAIVGPFPTAGWQQVDGDIYYLASDAKVKVLPLKLSGSMIYR